MVTAGIAPGALHVVLHDGIVVTDWPAVELAAVRGIDEIRDNGARGPVRAKGLGQMEKFLGKEDRCRLRCIRAS